MLAKKGSRPDANMYTCTLYATGVQLFSYSDIWRSCSNGGLGLWAAWREPATSVQLRWLVAPQAHGSLIWSDVRMCAHVAFSTSFLDLNLQSCADPDPELCTRCNCDRSDHIFVLDFYHLNLHHWPDFFLHCRGIYIKDRIRRTESKILRVCESNNVTDSVDGKRSG